MAERVGVRLAACVAAPVGAGVALRTGVDDAGGGVPGVCGVPTVGVPGMGVGVRVARGVADTRGRVAVGRLAARTWRAIGRNARWPPPAVGVAVACRVGVDSTVARVGEADARGVAVALAVAPRVGVVGVVADAGPVGVGVGASPFKR